jgi:hypothetical protein
LAATRLLLRPRSRKRVGLCARRRSSGAESAERVTDQPNSGARRVIGLAGPAAQPLILCARPSDPTAIYPNNTMPETSGPRISAFSRGNAQITRAAHRQGTLKGHALAAPSPPRTISRGQSVLCAHFIQPRLSALLLMVSI